MLRPFAALGLAACVLAVQPARAQFPPPPPECVAAGLIAVASFETRIVGGRLETPSLILEYVVTLRATRPVRFVNILFTTPNAPLVSITPELPVGVPTRVSLGTRNGPPLSDNELRSGLRVNCTPG